MALQIGAVESDSGLSVTRIIYNGSSRNGSVARDKREERDLRDV